MNTPLVVPTLVPLQVRVLFIAIGTTAIPQLGLSIQFIRLITEILRVRIFQIQYISGRAIQIYSLF